MLSVDRENALRIARRRESDPAMIEVFGLRAVSAGISIRRVGPELYLAEQVPSQYLLLPKLREDECGKAAGETRMKESNRAGSSVSPTPGSFSMEVRHLEQIYGESGAGGKSKSSGKSRRSWKQDARGERQKRIP